MRFVAILTDLICGIGAAIIEPQCMPFNDAADRLWAEKTARQRSWL
jgi:hypothetical protein